MISKLTKRLYDLILFRVKGGVWYAKRQGVKVGEGCRLYNFNWGTEPFLIEVGNKVTVTSGVKILTHDGSTWLFHDSTNNRYQKFGKVKIGDEVFIGVNSIVLPGITIGNRVVIGAGSVVTKDIPSGAVVAGNPAKLVCTYSELKKKVEDSCVSDDDIKNIERYEDRILMALKLQDKKRALNA